MFDVMDDAAFADAPAQSLRGEKSVRALLVAEAEYARASLGALCGSGSSVLVVHPDVLDAEWPAYVSARARTGGALVAEMSGGAEPEGFSELAEGSLFGHAARAGVVGGALVFLIGDTVPMVRAA